MASATIVAEQVEESKQDAEQFAAEAQQVTLMMEESQRQMNLMMDVCCR